ncbi:hypothetical protein HUO13_18435 [Saccharopolyspora erythraea]|uniref:hypothetical protein n=1 Tax=Saccharopolyspora erythraea TaxID=1836 RepID=UPI001BA8C1D9|nr:hypothetical protein [Saccharopolyspora erythraea]QUH02517.1 hypothetical protein HUO13_18435 [Saccharopolyspora erythraea]
MLRGVLINLCLAAIAIVFALGGGAVTWFALAEIVHYTPTCTPSPGVSCRYYVNGRDSGPATVAEQWFHFTFDTVLLLGIGVAALGSGLVLIVALARDLTRVLMRR